MSSPNSHVPALPGGPVRTCWTYLRFSPCSLFELRKVPHLRASMYEMADLTSWRVALAGRQIYDRYGVTWAGKRLLDIGCGQILGYTLPLAMANTVTGIDTELPLRRPILPAIWRTMRRSGLHRTIKSAVAAVLGQARLFEEGLRRATGFRGPFDYDLRCMDATKLEFPDASFEGVCSFSVLEHLADPRSALREMHRVLQPGGVCYLDLHLYTAIHGDHDPRGAAVPPWNHLRSPGRWRETCYVNKIRLPQWQELIREVFPRVHFLTIPGEADRTRQHLTPEIAAALSDYTEQELLTTTFIAVCLR